MPALWHVCKIIRPRLIRLFLVDDEPMVRRGLRLLLGLEPGLAVCGEADNRARRVAGHSGAAA